MKYFLVPHIILPDRVGSPQGLFRQGKKWARTGIKLQPWLIDKTNSVPRVVIMMPSLSNGRILMILISGEGD